MKLWYGSDLHSDFWDNIKPFTRSVDLTKYDGFLFAGDVGEWRHPHTLTILEMAADKGQVIHIPGNHEFYGGEYSRVLAGLADINGVNSLNQDYVDFAELKTRIWGDVMWTNFHDDEECMKTAERRMNDYRSILYQHPAGVDMFLYAKNTRDFHYQARASLKKAARSLPDGWRFIVMTHHAPTFLSIGKAFRKPSYSETARINAAYASNLDDWLRDERIEPDVWIHGHIHERANYEIEINDKICRVVSNPYGYPGEKSTTDFGDHYIEILEDRIVVV